MIYPFDRDQRIAWAAGVDAGDRFMRESGKKGEDWTFEAYDAAVKERNRIMDALYPGEER
jgi:hypothetical protein